MSAPRAIVLDRDGVLTRFDLDPVREILRDAPGVTFDHLWDAWHAWYHARPAPRDAGEERRFLSAFWDHVARTSSLPPDAVRRLAALDQRALIRPFPDARPALSAARARGVRIGVLSNFPLGGIHASLEGAGLADLVDAAVSAAVEVAPKPDPAAYRAIAAALGVRASECVLLDDEPPCVEGARSAGMRAFLVDRASAAPAPGALRDLSELAALLDRLREPAERACP